MHRRKRPVAFDPKEPFIRLTNSDNGARTGIPGHNYDANDTDSRRVRRGRIGGGLEHLDATDCEFIERACRNDLSQETRQLLDDYGVAWVSRPAAIDPVRAAA